MIVVALGKAVAALVWLSVLFPMISIPTIASVWIGLCYGPVFGLALAALSGLALAAWWQLSPASFHQWVTLRVWTQWRTSWVYRNRWTAICTLCGLTAKLDEHTRVRVPSPRGHAASHPGHRRFRLKPVPAIGDSVLSIGPSARFIAGTHTLWALLAKTVARRARAARKATVCS